MTNHRIDVADLRRRVQALDLHPVVDSYAPRRVQQRNTEAKPRVVDAVLLDDLWQVLDDIAAEQGR